MSTEVHLSHQRQLSIASGKDLALPIWPSTDHFDRGMTREKRELKISNKMRLIAYNRNVFNHQGEHYDFSRSNFTSRQTYGINELR
jgi:hypothetical protein